jgi:hypothetical protein
MKLKKFAALGLMGILLGCSQQSGTTWITDAEGNSAQVSFEAKEGLAVLEGDIVLGTVEEAQSRQPTTETQGSQTAIGARLSWSNWKNKTIPYTVDAKLDHPDYVKDAIAHWEAKTSIRFVPRTNEFTYVKFVPTKSRGCMSPIGKTLGRQSIYLHEKCSRGAVIHEIGHTVGLWHEQSRGDRDDFITIHWENISFAMWGQFAKHRWLGKDIGEYDFDSIMHYDAYAFSKNGNVTISRKDGGTTLGQREGLSPHDIAAVELMYR